MLTLDRSSHSVALKSSRDCSHILWSCRIGCSSGGSNNLTVVIFEIVRSYVAHAFGETKVFLVSMFRRYRITRPRIRRAELAYQWQQGSCEFSISRAIPVWPNA
jgi:hypothetical protein